MPVPNPARLLLLLGAALLAACQPAEPARHRLEWLPPAAPPALAPAPPPPPYLPDDTLVHAQRGFYVLLTLADTLQLWRQLPALAAAPGYQVYYSPRPAEYEDTLPRHFRLPGLEARRFHHETARIHPCDAEICGPLGLVCGPDARPFTFNAWRYERRYAEFPQWRSAAGPLTRLNAELLRRYTGGLVQDYSEEPWLHFRLDPARRARRPYHFELRAADTLEYAAEWRTPYRTLDTAVTYSHYPRAVHLVTLGAGPRLLGFFDVQDYPGAMSERPSAEEILRRDAPEYYSLGLNRWVELADVVRPALLADVQRALGPLLAQERRRYHLPPPDTSTARYQRRELQQPVTWELTRRGLLLAYMGAEEEARVNDNYYQPCCWVLIPYARLRPYLR